MPTKTQAEMLYERIFENDPYQEIKKMVEVEKRAEDKILDYKLALTDGKVDHGTIREICSKNYAAFANTDGGLLIWGVRCKEKQLPVVQEVPCLSELEMMLNRVVGECNEPVVNVEIRKVPAPGRPDQGFIVCFVPISRSRPHRADCAEGNKFYYPYRAGDSVKEFSHSHLRHMFYPYTKPDLRLKLICTIREFRIASEIIIENHGTMTAEDLMVKILTDHKITTDDGGRYATQYTPAYLPADVREYLNFIEVRFTKPIHPGSDEFGGLLSCSKISEKEIPTEQPNSYLIRRQVTETVKYTFYLFAKNAIQRKVIVVFDKDAINAALLMARNDSCKVHPVITIDDDDIYDQFSDPPTFQ